MSINNDLYRKELCDAINIAAEMMRNGKNFFVACIIAHDKKPGVNLSDIRRGLQIRARAKRESNSRRIKLESNYKKRKPYIRN